MNLVNPFKLQVSGFTDYVFLNFFILCTVHSKPITNFPMVKVALWFILHSTWCCYMHRTNDSLGPFNWENIFFSFPVYV